MDASENEEPLVGDCDGQPPSADQDEKAKQFQQIVDDAALACTKGDYETALQLYEAAANLDPSNHVVYGNCSAILCTMGRYEEAAKSAEESLRLNPRWGRGYYRKGLALKCSGGWEQAVVAFSLGLAVDRRSKQLLNALVDCALTCPLQEKFSRVYEEMCELGLEKCAFLMMSAFGQELLASGRLTSAVDVLQSALCIDCTSLALKQSVLSALSSAHCSLGNEHAALDFLQQNLVISETLGDLQSNIEVRRNLGYLCLKLSKPQEALEHLGKLADLLIQAQCVEEAVDVTLRMGQIYQKAGSFNSALELLNQCCLWISQWQLASGYSLKVTIALAGVHLAMGDHAEARGALKKATEQCRQCDTPKELLEALSALGNLYLFDLNEAGEAKDCLLEAFKVLQQGDGHEVAGRSAAVCASLVVCFWKLDSIKQADGWARRQLEIALSAGDKRLEAAACESLAFVQFQSGNLENARKLYLKQVELAKQLGEGRMQIQPYRALGIASAKMKLHSDAVHYHQAELDQAILCSDERAQCLARSSLCVPLIRCGSSAQATAQADAALRLADRLDDPKVKCESYKLVGDFHSAQGSLGKAVELYERYLMIGQEMNNAEEEMNACQCLGEAHFRIRRYREALRYLTQMLTIAKELKMHSSVAYAYTMLGRSHAALGKLDEALECHRYSMATAKVSHNVEAKATSLLYIAQVLTEMDKPSAALKVAHKALGLAKELESPCLQSAAYCQLSAALSIMGRFEKCAGCLAKAKSIADQVDDASVIWDVLVGIADCHRRQKKTSLAVRDFLKLAEFAKRRKLFFEHLEALRMLGDTCLEGELLDDAMHYYHRRLDVVKRSGSDYRLVLMENCLLDLAACYDRKKNWKRSARVYREIVSMAPGDRAESVILSHYRLGWALFHLTNFPEASEQFVLCLSALDAAQTEFRIQLLKLLAYCAFGAGQSDLCASHLKNRLNMARTAALAHHELCALIDVAYVSKNVTDALEVAGTALKLARAQHYADAQLKALEYMAYCKECELDLAGARFVSEEVRRCAEEYNSNKAYIVHYILEAVFDFDQHHLGAAVANLEEALNLAISISDIHFEAEVRMWLGIVLWASEKPERARTMLESALTLALNHCPMVSCHGFLRHEWSKVSLHETVGTLLLALLVSQNLPTDALYAAEKLRRIRFHLVSESLGFVGAGSSMLACQELGPRDLGQSVVIVVQIEDSLVLWTLKHGLIQMCALQMKGYSLGDLAKRLEPLASSMQCADYAFPRSHLLPAYHLRLPYENAELMASTLLLKAVKTVGLDQARARLKWAMDTVLPDTSSVLVVGTELTVLFPFEQIVDRKVCILYDLEVADMTNKGIVQMPANVTMVVSSYGEEDARLAELADQLSTVVLNATQLTKSGLLDRLGASRVLHLQLRYGKTFQLSTLNEGAVGVSDIADSGICASLVVLHVRTFEDEQCTPDVGYFWLTVATSFRAMGCGCVLLCLGNVDHFLAHFYRSFLDGLSITASMTAAEQYKPRDATCLLIGRDLFFDTKVNRLGEALRSLLSTPDECRESFRVVLHLAEKSLQRVMANETKPMFTNESSIRNKVGGSVRGWQCLLESIGFRRDVATDEPVWYFPLDDRQGLLTYCSASLQALIGLPQTTLIAFSKFCNCTKVVAEVLFKMESLVVQLEEQPPQYEVGVPSDLWNEPGVSMLYAALGFEKYEEVGLEVIVKTVRVNLTRKKLSMAIVAMKAVFNDLLYAHTLSTTSNSRADSSGE